MGRHDPQLQRMMAEEIDYRYETANLRRMRKLLKKHKVYVPRVYRKVSTPKVLVMEYITGVLMTDYLWAHRNDPDRLRAWCEQNNIKPRRVGSRLMRSFYRQLFEDNLFHGDLHPGNIILLRNSRFSLIDLGTVGNLEARFVRTYGTVVRTFTQGDYTKSVDAYLQLADSIPITDLAPHRVEMVEVMRAWEARSHLDGLSYYERSFTGGAATELSQIARKYKVNPSWQFLRVARSLNTMDASVSALLGNSNPNSIARKYFRQAQKRAFQRLRKDGLKRLGNAAAEASETAGYVSDLLRRQAIVFQGAQTKIAYFFSAIFSILRLVLIVSGIVLLYDFLDQHYHHLVSPWSSGAGILATWAAAIPPYAYGLGLLVLFAVVLLIVFSGRARKRLAHPVPRLPNGRLDT
ncbi:MAG: AarF/ABC1/UbiB kinase family protein [Caldilineales bacterium]